MLDLLKEKIINEYPDYINKSICNLGCDKERNINSKYNCSNPATPDEEFKLQIYMDIDDIKSKFFAKNFVKICDAIKINKNNILFIEITTPLIKSKTVKLSEKEKYDKIKREFIDKISGTCDIISSLLKKYNINISIKDIQIRFRPVFKPKPKCTFGQESYNILHTNLLLKALPIKNLTVLKYLKCL